MESATWIARTPDERRLVVERIQQRATEEQRSIRSMVAEHGISLATYQNWKRAALRQSSTALSFRPVAVTALVPAPSKLSVVTPAGYRVEGLSLEDVTRLLRSLG